MDKGLEMVIGMSLAYITSFAGLLLAYFSYKKHHPKKKQMDGVEIDGEEQSLSTKNKDEVK